MLVRTVSHKMLAHYSHVRMAAKREALEAISASAETRYDTNNDTNAAPAANPRPQVIERNGRPVGTRFTVIPQIASVYAALQPRGQFQSLRSLTSYTY